MHILKINENNSRIKLIGWLFILSSFLLSPFVYSQTSASRNAIPLKNVDKSAYPVTLLNYAKNYPHLVQKGVIDVTKSPYNAVGDGITDDLNAINLAINDAFNNNFAVFFPANKIFLLSGQLKLNGLWGSRKFAHILIGSTAGKAPILKLKDGSNLPRNIFILFQCLNDQGIALPASSYCSTIRGIDIDMGQNPMASAISLSGAQLCAIEDVKIYGQKFYAGVFGLPGSGGGVVNLKVTGGEIGIFQTEYRPNPTVEGLVLEGQSTCGIKITDSRGPVIISGFKIISKSSPNSRYLAIDLRNTASSTNKEVIDHGHGNLCLTDGTIEVTGSNGKAINNYAQDVTLNNVYVKAAIIIESGAAVPPGKSLKGDAQQWKKVSSYVFTSGLDNSTVLVNGINLNDRSANYEMIDSLLSKSPSEDLWVKHSWKTMPPSWEDNNLVDIVKDYGATTEDVNNNDDDGKVIQKAIDDVSTPGSVNYGKTVLIPRGYFSISHPLVIKRGVNLIGTSKNISVIQPNSDWSNPSVPLITTVDDANGSIVLSDFTIIGCPFTTFLQVQSGQTLIRDIVTEQNHIKSTINRSPSVPYIVFKNNAGGKVYNLSTDHLAQLDKLQPGSRYANYQLVQIKNTKNPLTFYQLSIEHLNSSPLMKIDNAQNVNVFGLKFESPSELLNIIKSNNINIIGGSGNYSLEFQKERAIIVIEQSTNILIQNLSRKSLSEMFNQPVNDICKYWVLEGDKTAACNYSLLLYRNRTSDNNVKILNKQL